jgi:hypothetical protein
MPPRTHAPSQPRACARTIPARHIAFSLTPRDVRTQGRRRPHTRTRARAQIHCEEASGTVRSDYSEANRRVPRLRTLARTCPPNARSRKRAHASTHGCHGEQSTPHRKRAHAPSPTRARAIARPTARMTRAHAQEHGRTSMREPAHGGARAGSTLMGACRRVCGERLRDVYQGPVPDPVQGTRTHTGTITRARTHRPALIAHTQTGTCTTARATKHAHGMRLRARIRAHSHIP